MPNPNDFISEEQVAQLEASGKIASVENPQPIIPGESAGGPPAQSSIDNYGGVPLPPNFGLQPDLTKTVYPSSTAPIRLMPIEGGPQTNAKTIGVAQTVVNEAIAAIPKTVIPASTPTLTDYSYPGLSWLRDDFIFGNTSTSNVGELKWNVINTAGTLAYGTGFPPHLGELWVPTTTTQGTGSNGSNSFVFPSTTTSVHQTAWDLLNNPGWKCTIVWRWLRQAAQTAPVFTNKTFYAGLCMYEAGNLINRPSVFIGARFDTDTTAPSIVDTTINLEAVVNAVSGTRNNTQGIVVNTGLAPTENIYYRLDIECTAVGTVVMSLNGASTTSFVVPKSTLTEPNTNAASANNGEGQYALNGGTGGVSPWSNGSSITISNMTGGAAVFNGSHILFSNGNNDSLIVFPTTTANFSANTAATIVGYPALAPFLTWGNNSTAGSWAADTYLAWDFFGFDWDPFTFEGTAPISTLSRFFGMS